MQHKACMISITVLAALTVAAYFYLGHGDRVEGVKTVPEIKHSSHRIVV